MMVAEEVGAATVGAREGGVSRSGTGDQTDAGGLRLFIVDDCRDTLRVLGRLLRGMGHEVMTADSLQSALAVAEEQPFDLLISDIELNDGSGIDLLRSLRARGPVKAIALSGHLTRDDICRSRDAGFLEHIGKPVQFQNLYETITRVAAERTRAAL